MFPFVSSSFWWHSYVALVILLPLLLFPFLWLMQLLLDLVLVGLVDVVVLFTFFVVLVIVVVVARLSSSLSLCRPSFLPLSSFWGTGKFCVEPGLCIFFGNAFHWCCSTDAFNSVLVANMFTFLTVKSGFITLVFLFFVLICIFWLFGGAASGRNGFLLLMCQLKNYRPWNWEKKLPQNFGFDFCILLPDSGTLADWLARKAKTDSLVGSDDEAVHLEHFYWTFTRVTSCHMPHDTYFPASKVSWVHPWYNCWVK